MKIVTFFSSALATFALVTHTLADDSATTTAPEGGYKGNGKSADRGGWTGNGFATTNAPESGFKGNGRSPDVTASTGGSGGGTDHGSGKKISLSGEAMCAKCGFHDGSTCQTVIQTKHHGTIEYYYVAQNDLAKELHKQVCETARKVKVSGFVEDVGGKQQLTLSKLTVKDK